MLNVIEKTVKRNPLENKKLYFTCVEYASGKTTKALDRHIDRLIQLFETYPDNQEVKDQLFIFNHLKMRRPKA